MATPHNEAKLGQIAKTVLMPGDPLRAKFIAENFLSDAVLVNNVRGVQGYTGTWKGVPVTVMASGMGIPAISIYSWELYTQYEVENIIRIGSAGAIHDDLQLMDLVIAQAACTNSNFPQSFGTPGTFAPIADYKLMKTLIDCAEEHGARYMVGNILSSDNFYYAEGCGNADLWKRMGVLAVEMEAAGLFSNAAYLGKRAACVCTISDHLYRDEALSSEDRQNSFRQMMEIALDAAIKLN